jgi:large subunit ribosomal protein L24
MKIKTGDSVIVLTGKDKGKTGKVVKAFPREDKIVIEGVNVKKRRRKATREGSKGQVIEMAHPIHVSNVRKEGEAKAAAKQPKAAAAKKPASQSKEKAKVKAE